MTEKPRVVITGLGILPPRGVAVQAVQIEELMDGTTQICES